jgi:hypothetical protein
LGGSLFVRMSPCHLRVGSNSVSVGPSRLVFSVVQLLLGALLLRFRGDGSSGYVPFFKQYVRSEKLAVLDLLT